MTEPLGHKPEIHRVLAHKILCGHLRSRNRLMEWGITDLSRLQPAEARLMILAMAAAAHADGLLDQGERAVILKALADCRIDREERLRLERAIELPPSAEALLREVKSPEQAARFYASSLAAVDKDRAVSRAYLAYVAVRLALPVDQVVRLNRRQGLR